MLQPFDGLTNHNHLSQAMQVSQAGDIANFMIPGKLVKGKVKFGKPMFPLFDENTHRYWWRNGPCLKP
jgi:hypothetical protein